MTSPLSGPIRNLSTELPSVSFPAFLGHRVAKGYLRIERGLFLETHAPVKRPWSQAAWSVRCRALPLAGDYDTGSMVTKVSAQVGDYLARQFPEHESSREWDPSRGVMVFRLVREGKTMLVELSSEALADDRDSVWSERLDRWGLPERLRKDLRLRVTPSGLETLPWKQLARRGASLEEELLESFPASDPSSRSSVSSRKTK